MQCTECGQRSDWVGDGSDWEHVTDSATVHGLYVCEVCGNKQRSR